MAEVTGVFPVYENIFKVNTAGRGGTPANNVIIKDMTTFKLAIEGKTEEWYPIDESGWARAAITGKKMSVELSGKRNHGDPGNDYVAGLAFKTGKGCESDFEWTLTNGDKVSGKCVLDVKSIAGGDSTAIDELSVTIILDGKPTYTAAE